MPTPKAGPFPPRRVADWKKGNVELSPCRAEPSFHQLMRVRHQRGVTGEEAALRSAVEQIHVRRASPSIEPVAIPTMSSDRGMNGDMSHPRRATRREVFGVVISASP